MDLKKSSYLTCIFIVLCTVVYAQKSPIKFGKISEEEIKMTVYEKDTAAEAVVLADYGEAEIVYIVNVGFQLNYSRHKRIKILKKEGTDWANVSIRLYQDPSGKDENLGSLKASTYNFENGKLIETKFSKKDLMTEVESKNWMLKKFAFPDVKVGSIIEYDYSYASPYYWSLQDWYFQEEIPVIWSELRTSIPEYFDFRRLTGGYISSSISEEKSNPSTITGTDIRYVNYYNRIVFQNVPAFRDEDFITTPNDYKSRVEFQLRTVKFPNSMIENYATSWNDIAKSLLQDENFGLALNRSGIVKELTEQINPSDSAMNKINTAFNLIRKHMKWDESFGVYTQNTLRAAFNKNQGNMAEVNLLLVNLLRSVGIDANPVVFSTRSHGMVREFYPMFSAFNGVLASAKVNGKDILLDATSAFTKPGEISPDYINGNGMKILENKIEWIPLISGEQINSTTMITLYISENKVTGLLIKNTNSSGASILRSKIAKTGKQQYIDDFRKNSSQWDIKNYAIENEENAFKPFVEKIEIENFNQIDASGDMVYLPAIISSEIEKNPFTSENRIYPVDFAVPISEKHILNISIPENFQVEELPASIVYTLPDNAASYTYKTQKSGSNIQIFSQLKISRTIYRPQEYQMLKEFFGHIIAKHGEQIVLKKI